MKNLERLDCSSFDCLEFDSSEDSNDDFEDCSTSSKEGPHAPRDRPLTSFITRHTRQDHSKLKRIYDSN